MCVLGPKLAEFARTYPDVVLDVSADETRRDLVAGGFDAGVQYGEFIQHHPHLPSKRRLVQAQAIVFEVTLATWLTSSTAYGTVVSHAAASSLRRGLRHFTAPSL
jgi:hypothetical protein